MLLFNKHTRGGAGGGGRRQWRQRAADSQTNDDSAAVFMNRCDYLDPDLVWTGVKNTGKGASLSKYGFDGVVQLKNLHFKL